MKNKKIFLTTLIGLAVFLFSACSSDKAQQEFVDNFSTATGSEYNASKFKLTLDDFNYSGNEDAFSVNMIAAQLKNVAIEGSYAADYDNKSMESEINVSVMNQTFPIQVVGNNEKLYMSTSFISSIYNILGAFNRSAALPQSTLEKLDGKFIDLIELIETQNNIDTSGYYDSTTAKDQKELQEKLKKEILTFDKKSFSKDGNTVSHTFTKDECKKLMDIIFEYYKKDLTASEKKDFENGMKDFEKGLEEMNADYSVAVKIDTKTKKNSSKFKLKMANPENKKENIELAIKYVTELQKNKEAITMPKQSEILPMKEIEKIISEAVTSTSPGVGNTGDWNNPYEDYFDSSSDSEL